MTKKEIKEERRLKEKLLELYLSNADKAEKLHKKSAGNWRLAAEQLKAELDSTFDAEYSIN